LGVGAAFFTMSVLFASWLARIPEIQARLGLSEGQLGFSLLGASLGALCAMPLSGWILGRVPAGMSTLYSTLAFCLAVILPVLAWDRWSFTLALFLLGIVNGVMNVSMNASASALERHYQWRIMSACHGLFSLGGMTGAIVAGIFAAWAVPLPAHLSILALLMLLFNLRRAPALQTIPSDGGRGGPVWTLPRGALRLLTLIGFCIVISEGAIADWSAIYLRNDLSGGPLIAGFGYAGFSLTMALGRFLGDRVRAVVPARVLLTGGALTGALGLLTAVFASVPLVAVLGFSLVGLGFSIIIPVLYVEAARTPGVKPESAIAAIASFGIVGLLLGPPLIGLIAEHSSLSASFALLAVLALAAAGAARWGMKGAT
jgi:MFS family permease